MRSQLSLAAVSLFVAAGGCSSSSSDKAPSCTTDAECSSGAPICDGAAGTCVTSVPGGEIGHGDGTAGTVTLTEIGDLGAASKPTDLGFNPNKPDELWVVSYGDDSVHVASGIGTDNVTWKRFHDPAAMHFMHKPPALAMGAVSDPSGPSWGVCGDNDNGQNATNSDGTANDFMGPSLMTLDLSIFAVRTPKGLGSHIDMLHESPFCRGIAHVEANVYWVFNAMDGALDWYNFNKDHGPGNDDHSDGEVWRYAKGEVKGADGIPSHVFYDPSDKFLYVADTGNQRVARLDTTSGTKHDQVLPRTAELLKSEGMVDGATLTDVVPAGTLSAPSGIEVKGDLVYVTDAATSTFYVFDKTGKPIRSLATGLPESSLAGFTFGADGKIYFTDRVASKVYRIDPR